MKKYKIYSLVIVLLLFTGIISSCSDDFYDVNENPNNPPASTPELTLPVGQNSFASLNGTSMNYIGQFMVYNWAVPSNWSAQENLLRYNITNQTFSTIFETSYVSIFKNLTYVENYEDPNGVIDYSGYQAIAKIIKAFQYQYLVDLYGDVPYTEANLRIENPTPAYDDAEFIYKSLIDELTNVIDVLDNLPANAENPNNQDIIFGGDWSQWQKFANTIKLRMLIRMSDSGQDSYVQSEMDKIVANGKGFITSNVAANPGYSDNADKQSPFYGYIGENPGSDEVVNRNKYTVATDYTINYLDFTSDPRLERLYAPAEVGGYHGVEQNVSLPGEGFTTKDLSTVGPGLLVSSEQDQNIMLLAEALLLQSEAKLKGLLPGGDAAAKADYEEAIRASMAHLGVQDGVEDYISNPIDNVNWDASDDKLEAIITQKWIALNGTNGAELWVEKTRTGFPSGLPLSVSAQTNQRPIRLLYPDTEVARNSENVPSQTTDAAFNNVPFWKN